MQSITVRYNELFEVAIANDRTVVIGPGVVHGQMTLKPYVDRDRCSADMGFSELELRFRDRNGDYYRHANLLGPMVLWPSEEVMGSRHGVLGEVDASLHTVIDYRNAYAIRLDDGSTISGVFKQTDARFDVEIKDFALAVRLRLYVHDVASSGKPGFETIYYEIAYQRVLWRYAPVILDDEVIPEGQDYVRLDQDMEQGGNLEKSDIRIV